MAFRRPWLIPEDPMPKSEVRAGMARAAWRAFPDARELGLVHLRETYATRAHARTMLECGILLDALIGDVPTAWRAAVEFAKASRGRCTLDIGRRSRRDLLLVLEMMPGLFDLESAWRPTILGHALADSDHRSSIAEAPRIRGIAERTGTAGGWALIDDVGKIVSSGNFAMPIPFVRGEPFVVNLEHEEIELDVDPGSIDYTIGMGVGTMDGRHWRVIAVDMVFDVVANQQRHVRLRLRRDRSSETSVEARSWGPVRQPSVSITKRTHDYDYSRDAFHIEAAESFPYREPEKPKAVVVAAKKAKKRAVASSMQMRAAPPSPPKRGFNAPRRR